jgi:hypothetical protein
VKINLREVTKDQNERLKTLPYSITQFTITLGEYIMMRFVSTRILNYKRTNLELLNTASNNLKQTIEHLNEVVLMNTT